MPDLATADVLTITAHDSSYLIRDPGGRVGSKLVNGEPYERKLLDDVYRRQLSGVAFDIGAHVGNHTLYMAAVCGLTVLAFEPHPVSYRMLAGNMALNPGLEIHAYNYAAGSKPGRARFAGQMQLKTQRGHIPVRRLDDEIPPLPLVVVKVDVEGMEPEALAGMSGHLSRCKPIVYVETHTKTAHRRTAAVLEPLDYRATSSIAMGSVMNVWEYR